MTEDDAYRFAMQSARDAGWSKAEFDEAMAISHHRQRMLKDAGWDDRRDYVAEEHAIHESIARFYKELES